MKEKDREIWRLAVDLIPNNLELVTVDYRDDMRGNGDLIARSIKARSSYPLLSEMDEVMYDQRIQGVNEVIGTLKEQLGSSYSKERLDEFFDEHNLEIKEVIEDREVGDPVRELLRHTSMLCRIELYSNYEAFCPLCYSTSFGYVGYAVELLKTLQLNPVKVKNMLESKGVKCSGRFPYYARRDGKEVISYDDFYLMLSETFCYSRLTFVGNAPLEDMYDKDFKLKKVTVPKGTKVLMFDSWNGSGSVEIETMRDVVLDLNKIGKTKYDHLKLIIDEPEKNGGCGYSTDEVYGWGYRFDELFSIK